MISQILFVGLLASGIVLFARRVKQIRANILLGKDLDRTDRPVVRWKTMFKIALGQIKMVKRPVSGILHIIVYAGFIIVNIEMLEIVLDGILGTHRLFAPVGTLYSLLIGSFEVFALLVILACATFLVRRNVIRMKRFHSKEMTTWPKTDANIILVTEILLMSAFIFMNAADMLLQDIDPVHYASTGTFPISSVVQPLLLGFSENGLVLIERGLWWFHIVGVMAFLVYVTYSKHFHILLAFPNTYYSNLENRGKLPVMPAVLNEVKTMLDPNADPYADSGTGDDDDENFGANDVQDLTWKQLMDGYACTECGRCTSVCPANMTGKLLSPRKILMDTRDRLEEVGKNIRSNNGEFVDDKKSLLYTYITEEELWGCTTCVACVEACPVLIDPLSTIIDLRRYLVLSEGKPHSQAAESLEKTMNTGNPWGYSQSERTKWATDAGFDLPLMSEKKEADVLYWVGCAGSYDPRNQQVSKAMIKILEAAEVDYAVLGTEESCTGDSARRLGEEYLFETMALQNIETFKKYKFNKIVAPCPHCFHTIGNEYTDFEVNYNVQHHSQFIGELIASGKLKLKKYYDEKVTYHDPCYLGRHNNEYDASRNIINGILKNDQLIEMKQNRKNSFCCGAGGGNMWYDLEGGDRINYVRFQEAIDTGADVVATACSFCTFMMDDAMKVKGKEDTMQVLDIAEMVATAL